MRKLLVASQKGGVGKSTTSMNLAAATALTGTRVLLLVADPISNVSTALNLTEHPQRQSLRPAGIDLPGVFVPNLIPGLDVLSPYDEGSCTDEEFARLLRALVTTPIRKCYGCTIVDVPPFLGGSAAQLLANCDDLLLVMRAEEMAYRTFPAFLELMQRSSHDGHTLPMRGILLTLPEGEEPGCRMERELRGRFGTRVLAEVIPHDDSIGAALRSGRIGSDLYPDSPAAKQYHQLVAKLELADTAKTALDVEAILQALREAATLAGTATPARSAPLHAADTLVEKPALAADTLVENPAFAPPSENVRPAVPAHRPRRLSRSGESLRQTRPERTPSTAAACPARRKTIPAKGKVPGEDVLPLSAAPASSPQPTSHALAQLWPLWILLGAILGGVVRFLPPPPSFLPILNGLAAALFVVVVLFTLARKKRAATSDPCKQSRWRIRWPILRTALQKEAPRDFLSDRLANLANNSRHSPRSADSNPMGDSR